MYGPLQEWANFPHERSGLWAYTKSPIDKSEGLREAFNCVSRRAWYAIMLALAAAWPRSIRPAYSLTGLYFVWLGGASERCLWA
jgi:hypothetical protein